MEQHENARSGDTLQIALFGADALLAARPATPVQFIHACLAAGYDAAYPVSWGDELVAQACLNTLRQCESGPVALCTCPHATKAARRRGTDALLVLASPPVATARVVRAAYPDRAVHVTLIGTCPAGDDPAIDTQLFPTEFLTALASRGIAVAGQPESFDAVLPPDRRRFLSLPGGTPTSEQLEAIGWRLVHEPALAVQHHRTLIDEAPHLGCACSASPEGRLALAEIEPPRATSPIFDPDLDIDMSPTAPAAGEPERQPHSPDTAADDVAASPAAPPHIEALDQEVPVDTSVTEPGVVLEEAEPVAPQASPPRVVVYGRPGETPDIRTGEPGSAPFKPILAIPQDTHRRTRRAPAWGHGLEVRPRRRLDRRKLVIALLLLVTVPLAAFGGWALVRGGWLPITFANRPSARQPVVTELPGVIATAPEDSVVAVGSADSATAVSATADSAAPVDSLAAVASTSDTLAMPTAKPAVHVRQAGSAPAPVSAPRRVGASPTQPVPRRARTTPPAVVQRLESRRPAAQRLEAQRLVPDPTQDSSVVSQRDSAEIRMLREEIARRRARLDSLSRVVDSLRRTRPKPR